MCMESVDLCSGINFRGNCADEQEHVAPEQEAMVADPQSLFLLSVEECPGVDPNGAGEKTWKLSSTVGQIFRDKIGAKEGTTNNERKRIVW